MLRTGLRMYQSLQLPWSRNATVAENAYKAAGLVKTKGTLFMLPPPVEDLVKTFNEPPRPKSRMSSGAVALCKHFERGGASSEHGKAHPFWPLPVGSNENKSKMATSVLDKMLQDVQWRNTMVLHAGVAVYEIRNGLGYGMRWTLQLKDDTESTKTIDDVERSNESAQELQVDEPEKYEVTQVTFRGFLEPIVGLDHELPSRRE